MKKFTLLALFILINFVAIGQTLSGADKQTVNISGSNTAVTLDTFAKFYNPFITDLGNKGTQDSALTFESLTVNNLNTLSTTNDVLSKPVSDLIYNKAADKTSFKIVRIDSNRVLEAGFDMMFAGKNTGGGVFGLDTTKPFRFRNGEPYVQNGGSYYVARSVSSKDYNLQIETYTNADTICITVVDANRKIYVNVDDSLYFLVQTSFINNIATYKLPIPYKSKGYRLVTIGMSDALYYKIGVKTGFNMYKPDYETSHPVGVISDSYSVGQVAITHLDLLSLSNKTSDFWINGIGGASYSTFSTMVKKFGDRNVNEVYLMGGFNNFATDTATLRTDINRFLDSCSYYNIKPNVFLPFKPSEVEPYNSGVKIVYKYVADVAKNYIVYNPFNIIFDFGVDNIHPDKNGYVQIYEGIKYAFSCEKIQYAYHGLIDLSYVPTSSTDLQLEALTAPINSEWLLLDGATYYRILKVSTTSLHRFAYASF